MALQKPPPYIGKAQSLFMLLRIIQSHLLRQQVVSVLVNEGGIIHQKS